VNNLSQRSFEERWIDCALDLDDLRDVENGARWIDPLGHPHARLC
jgi:hypothetical protein